MFSDGRLLRVLGVGFGLAVIIGNTIGAGIFRAPGGGRSSARPQPLYRRVGRGRPLRARRCPPDRRTGCDAPAIWRPVRVLPLRTRRIRRGSSSDGATGSRPAVRRRRWRSSSPSFSTELLPVIGESVPAFAGAVAAGFAAAQWRGIRQGSLIQNVTTALKGAAFAALIVAAFVFGGTAATADAATPPVASGLSLATAFVLALQSVIYTYDGWTGVVYFSEEVRDPGTDIPRALITGVLSITAIYVLLNLSFLHVLPIGAIAGRRIRCRRGRRHALRRPRRPRAAHHRDCLARQRRECVPFNGEPRAVCDESRRARRWSRGNRERWRHAHRRPCCSARSSLCCSSCSAGRSKRLITVLAFFFIANYTLSFISLIVLRRSEPDRPRPYPHGATHGRRLWR